MRYLIRLTCGHYVTYFTEPPIDTHYRHPWFCDICNKDFYIAPAVKLGLEELKMISNKEYEKLNMKHPYGAVKI